MKKKNKQTKKTGSQATLKKRVKPAARPARASKPKKTAAKPAAHPAGKTTQPGKSAAPARLAPVRPVLVSTPPRRVVAKGRKLTASEKKHFREMLIALREDMTTQVNKLKEESLKRDDAVVSEEDGTDAFDRQFALTLASSENEALMKIEDALRKVEAGDYGMCEGCGGMIELPRLKALPFVQMCIACQSEEERRKMKFRPVHRLPQ